LVSAVSSVAVLSNTVTSSNCHHSHHHHHHTILRRHRPFHRPGLLLSSSSTSISSRRHRRKLLQKQPARLLRLVMSRMPDLVSFSPNFSSCCPLMHTPLILLSRPFPVTIAIARMSAFSFSFAILYHRIPTHRALAASTHSTLANKSVDHAPGLPLCAGVAMLPSNTTDFFSLFNLFQSLAPAIQGTVPGKIDHFLLFVVALLHLHNQQLCLFQHA